MRGVVRVTNPDDVFVTLELTLPMRQWKDLRSALGDGDIAVNLSLTISHLIHEIERRDIFSPPAPKEDASE